MPDLFSGSQLVVLGRYSGKGPAAIRLTGKVGTETREFVYEMNLEGKGGEGRDFVEHLWARRKVGYLLDQVRMNGEKKELIDEITTLAKRYGIATPYTSYLIVPDAPMPVARGFGGRGFGREGLGLGGAVGGPPAALNQPAGGAGAPVQQRSVVDFAKDAEADRKAVRDVLEERRLREQAGEKTYSQAEGVALADALARREAFGAREKGAREPATGRGPNRETRRRLGGRVEQPA